MKSVKVIAGVFGLAFLVVLLAPSCKANEWNKKTIVTINEPFEISGRVLEPGKYVFRLMDSDSNRHIVQIFNAEENHVYATIFAVPRFRFKPTDKTEITFWEGAASAPQALRTWFYPGDEYGDEFVYHQVKALGK